jgi:hypothetical protein
MFRRNCHWSLPSARQIVQAHPLSTRSTWILSSHLCLGFPSGLFLSCFRTMTYTFICPMCATRPTHTILLHLIMLIIFEKKTVWLCKINTVIPLAGEICSFYIRSWDSTIIFISKWLTFGHYSPSCFYLRECFTDWSLSPSSGYKPIQPGPTDIAQDL